MIPQSGKVAENIQSFFYYLLRALPTEWASAIGSYGIRMNARLSRPDTVAGAKRNLRFHRPGATEAEIDAMVDEFLDGVGRVAAEFSVMHRFMDEGRIEYVGLEHLHASAGKVPLVALCVHTGNWEIFAHLFKVSGVKLNSIIQPPDNAFERRVIENVRSALGVSTILPDIGGIRQALRLLHANQVVSMFPDEARGGKTMGPLFGRPPHDRGNLAIAAKLARKTGASFILGHCRRIAPCRFRIEVSPVFTLPPAPEKPDILADVAFLNGWIEPIIQANIPRWYFLDDDIGPIDTPVGVSQRGSQ